MDCVYTVYQVRSLFYFSCKVVLRRMLQLLRRPRGRPRLQRQLPATTQHLQQQNPDTSEHVAPLGSLVSREEHSAGGTSLDSSTQQEHPAINVSTTSTLLSPVTEETEALPPQPTPKQVHAAINAKVLSMPECLPPSNVKTWNVRYRHSLKNSVDTELFQTLAVASISRGQDFRSLSSVVSTDMLRALWLPTATDFAASPSTSSTSCLKPWGSHSSLFTTTIMTAPPQHQQQDSLNLERTSWPSFMSSRHGITAKDITGSKTRRRSQRQRVETAAAGATTTTEVPQNEDVEDEEDQENVAPATTTTTTATKKRTRPKKSATLKANNQIMRCVSIPVSLYPTGRRSTQGSTPVHQQLVSKEKREVLHKMFGTYRHIYNTTVKLFNDKKITANQEYEVRQKLTKLDGEWAQPWYNELPTASKQKAVSECFTQVKTNLKKGGNFTMKFKTKLRTPQQCLPYGSCKVMADARTIVLPYELKGNASSLRCIELFMKKGVPNVLKGRNDTGFIREEVKVVLSRNGNLHIVIPITLSQREEATGDDEQREVKLVALDPGVRTFQTFYTPHGDWGKIGTSSGDGDGLKKVEALLYKIDKTISTLARGASSLSSLNMKRRRWLKRSKYRRIDRVKNLKNDFHRKTCVWLLQNFDVILLPVFEVQRMVTNSRLSSKTCRAMYTWSHYAFKQRLLDMAQKYSHKKCSSSMRASLQ